MGSSLEDMTDEKLMLECQKDSLDAFNLLFRRYEKRIYNLSVRLVGDISTAEEITLDTFMRAYKARKRYKPTARLSTWLYCIARNLCKDTIKSKVREEAISGSAYQSELATAESGNPGKMAENEEFQERIKKAIESLPRKQREVIIMNYYEGLRYSEIAVILKCSLGSVKMAAHRAHLRLAELLSSA